MSRLTERVVGLQKLHTSELAAIEASAHQQAAAAQGEAQAALDRLSSAGGALKRERDAEAARAEGLAVDVARLQVSGGGYLEEHTVPWAWRPGSSRRGRLVPFCTGQETPPPPSLPPPLCPGRAGQAHAACRLHH